MNTVQPFKRHSNLAPYACHHEHTQGRVHQEPVKKDVKLSYRNEFQRDRDRIIHSTAFRRLEYKTQVFINHEGDLFRTRLTHSVEVAQIGRTVARALGLHEDLTEAICLAHDLGHTPFGHAGQDALDKCMRDYGGFEHNVQSLRVVDYLESKYAEFDGLNLCYETREGILKHCTPENAKRLGELGQRFFNHTQPSLEAQLANIADGIAYNTHDVDDGLRSGLITMEQLCAEVPFVNRIHQAVKNENPELPSNRVRYEVVRRMITIYVNDLIEHSLTHLSKHQPQSVNAVRDMRKPIIQFSAPVHQETKALKAFLFNNLYRHYQVNRMVSKATAVIQEQFDAYMDKPQLLPHKHQARVKSAEKEWGGRGKARVIADYIAGMTDRYAISEYEQLFNPQTRI